MTKRHQVHCKQNLGASDGNVYILHQDTTTKVHNKYNVLSFYFPSFFIPFPTMIKPERHPKTPNLNAQDVAVRL